MTNSLAALMTDAYDWLPSRMTRGLYLLVSKLTND